MKTVVTLTKENGNNIVVNANKILFIEHLEQKDLHYPNSNSIVHFETLSVFVRETKEEVEIKIAELKSSV